MPRRRRQTFPTGFKVLLKDWYGIMGGNLNIGNMEIAHPFLLAPLAGVTDSPFRRICKEKGAALVYSEMVSAKGLYYSDKNTASLLDFHEAEMPLMYQLFGSDEKIMAWSVERLADHKNDAIDINMGCPVPKVVKNGEGAALMRTPEKAASIVAAMVKTEKEVARRLGRRPKPITVKCRMGWDSESINGIEFALRMEEAGASAIAIHGRTRDQYYSGRADWEFISSVKERLSIPLIGSGDIFSGEDAINIIEKTGCDFVMIARGALGNPWIFQEAVSLWEGEGFIEAPHDEEIVKCIESHMELSIKSKGEFHAVREMRKHIGWYVKGRYGAAEIRRRINEAATKKDVMEILEGLLLKGKKG
ncbi:MAG: tRNA dihydrouridine synthase DusB [Anaerovoracaceae bacterium]|jgi:tRNA-dihydrouridine synthase B